jgi:hypothetical protein
MVSATVSPEPLGQVLLDDEVRGPDDGSVLLEVAPSAAGREARASGCRREAVPVGRLAEYVPAVISRRRSPRRPRCRKLAIATLMSSGDRRLGLGAEVDDGPAHRDLDGAAALGLPGGFHAVHLHKPNAGCRTPAR